MEILGVIDALESILLSGARVPLTDKIIVEESKIMPIIDKLRTIAREGGSIAKRMVDVEQDNEARPRVSRSDKIIIDSLDSNDEMISDAYQQAQRIKLGADQYADQVLAQLQMLTTKMQRNVFKMEQSIDNGRKQLKKGKEEEDRIADEELLEEDA